MGLIIGTVAVVLGVIGSVVVLFWAGATKPRDRERGGFEVERWHR